MATRTSHFIAAYTPISHTARIEPKWLFPALARFMDAYATDDTAQWKPYWTGIDVLSVAITHPSSDVSVTGWVPSTGTDLFACIDEAAYDDADYITSPTVGTGSPATLGLSQSLAVGTWDVRVRVKKSGSTGQVRIHLVDASDTIQGTSSWQSLSTSLTTYTFSITTTDITTRVRIEVQA